MINHNINPKPRKAWRVDLRGLLRIAFALMLTIGPMALTGVILAVDDINVFELEGDAVDNPTLLGDDWDRVNLGSGGGSIARTGVLSDPAPATIFTQGGSKDHIDISSWRHKDGSVPSKDDITNAYAAAYNVNGDLVIYFGADRFANDGDAQLGFWFFQEAVGTKPDGTFSGVHQVGDILVLANFSQGGSVATIQVLKWVGTGGDQHGGTLQLLSTSNDALCGPDLGDHTVCAITNKVAEASPWPYTPKSGSPGIFPPFSFFEGGINISKIFAGSPPCFASFLAETRSSTSINAVLKDFVLGSFEVCGIEITKTCPTSTVNEKQTGFIYSFVIKVTNVGFGNLYDLIVVDDAGTPGDTSDDIKFNQAVLGPGATATFNGTFESQQNPATNRASVTAASSPGGPATITDETDPVKCPPVTRSPNISVTKVCDVVLTVIDGRVVVRVNFSGQSCNIGNIGLDQVKVTDNSGTPDNTADDQVFDLGSLEIDQCKPYSGNYLPAGVNTTNPSSASFTDTVKATGVGRLGFGNVEETRTATCPLCPSTP